MGRGSQDAGSTPKHTSAFYASHFMDSSWADDPATMASVQSSPASGRAEGEDIAHWLSHTLWRLSLSQYFLMSEVSRSKTKETG